MVGALERRDPGEWLGHLPQACTVSPIWDRFDFTDARLSRSKALYEQNLILLDESRRLIAVSRRLLNRAWELGGSSLQSSSRRRRTVQLPQDVSRCVHQNVALGACIVTCGLPPGRSCCNVLPR